MLRHVPSAERQLYAGVALLFVISRLAFALVGIAPDPEWLLNHMQLADPQWLAEDPLGTVLHMHSQPPLWNLILGLFAVAFDGEPHRIARAVGHMYSVMSLAAVLLLLASMRRLGVSWGLRWLAGAAFVVLPSVLFFENYVLYQHQTFVFVTLFSWAWLAYLQDGKAHQVWLALGALSALAWTWSVFHPLLIVMVALAGWFYLSHERRRRLLLPAAALLALAFVPTVKNAVVFGIPSSASWVPLNIFQIVARIDEHDDSGCAFATAAERAQLLGSSALTWEGPRSAVLLEGTKPSGYPNYHHYSVLGYARGCMDKATSAIVEQPVAYLQSVAWAAIQSHSFPGYIFGFDPLNWERLSFYTAPFDGKRSPAKYLMLVSFLVLWGGMGAFAIRSRNRAFYLACLGLVAYFTLVIHATNGSEQARMRYSISPLYLLVTFALLERARVFVASGAWAQRRWFAVSDDQRHERPSAL